MIDGCFESFEDSYSSLTNLFSSEIKWVSNLRKCRTSFWKFSYKEKVTYVLSTLSFISRSLRSDKEGCVMAMITTINVGNTVIISAILIYEPAQLIEYDSVDETQMPVIVTYY